MRERKREERERKEGERERREREKIINNIEIDTHLFMK